MDKIEKILARVVKTILNVIFVILSIIALILIYNIIQISVLHKPYMNFWGYSIFQVQTGSMAGTLEIQDIIVVKLTKDVKQNDIITFTNDGSIITHRIIEIEGETITTKGDANNSEDKPITKNDVIGKVVYTFKNIAIWKQVFATPQVIILLATTLILFGISTSINEEKKVNKE